MAYSRADRQCAAAASEIKPPDRDLTITWMCEQGQLVAPGDVIMRFDSSHHERALVRAAAELARAADQFRIHEAEKQVELKALEEELTQLQTELRTIEAELARLGDGFDHDAIALATATRRHAELALVQADNRFQQQQLLLELGQISVSELHQAEDAVARQQRNVQRERLSEAHVRSDDRPLERAGLALRAAVLAKKIGRKAENANGPESESENKTDKQS